jgi:hypothetical protein
MPLIGLGDFTKKKKAAIPWGQVAIAPGEWVKNWDDQICLKEPTKMKLSDINALYKHLLERQSSTGDALEWIKSGDMEKKGGEEWKGKGKGKASALKEESDENEESMGDSEEDDFPKASQKTTVKVQTGEGSAGSSSKRPHGMSDRGDIPAKRQKQVVVEVVEKSGTRYGAPYMCPLMIHIGSHQIQQSVN